MNLRKQNIPENDMKGEDLEMARKKVIEKVAITLKIQHIKIFKRYNYTVKNLISDLKQNITQHDINTLPYDIIYGKVQKIVLDKLSSLTDKNNSKSTDISSNKSMIQQKPKKEELSMIFLYFKILL